MDRYPDNLNDWSLEFVKELVDEEHEENAFLEYKLFLKDVDKTELEREFTAFANGKGGFILFGVRDDHEICGIDIPEDEELTQYIKELLTNTNPVVQFQVGDPIKLSEDTQKGILVVKVDESNKKPVATRDSAYYIRMGESKQPVDREHLMTLFVHRDKQQENRRILEMEINRYLRVHKKFLEDINKDAEPVFYKLYPQELRDAIRLNNWLYADEETAQMVDDVLDRLQKLKELEDEYKGKRVRKQFSYEDQKSKNIDYNGKLNKITRNLKPELEKLKKEVTN